jgi:peptide/nickel transport system substrate-binding protein
VKRRFFQNEKFKQAMSVAINRGEINDLLFFGRAVPRQSTTIPSTSYYEDWMGEYYAQYDPDLANRLLDEIGLDKKDADGNRLGPDGKPLTILVETGPWEVYPKIAEMIAGYWTAVGIKSSAKTISAGLAGEKVRANDFEAQLQGFAQVSEFLIHPDNVRMRPPWIRNAYPWYLWLDTGGAQGEEPPAEVKRLWEAYEEFHTTVPGSPDYMRLGKEVLELNVKGLYAIGTVGLEPMPVVVKNYVRNVPPTGMIAWDFYFWTPYQAASFYIDR